MSQTADDKFNGSNIHNRKYARRLSINNRELLIAISENDYDKVEYLLNGEIDINFKDADGKTPLYWAIESNNEAIIKLLLNKQGINIKSTEIETLVDYVQRFNRPNILKILETSLKLNVKDQNAVTKQDQCNSKRDQVSKFSTFKQLESWQKNKIQKKRKNAKNPIHGNIYQLNLLMLFLYRSISLRYSFQLGTEISEANKFDDIVFEYIENGKTVYRLLQAKHKLNESKVITACDLFAEYNGDYSLIKYFFSYQKAKNNKLFKNGLIKDVTICTNIDWDYEDLKNVKIGIQKIRDKDDILDFKNIEKQPVRYKFCNDVAVLLKSKIDYHASNLGKKSIKYTDDDIKDFLNHLVFAVNQPNAEELGNIVENEIGKELGLIMTEIVYNKFFREMLNWLMGKGRDRFLSAEEGKKFLEEAKLGVLVWFNVRDPTCTFVGRDKELFDLHNMLQNRSENISKFICISGLSGVGKSELVRYYINQYSQEYDNKIIWINAESYQTLVESFHRLASDKLGISTINADNKEKKICSIVEDVYKLLSSSKCLFIFDNAVKYKSENEFDYGIENFLPFSPCSCNKSYILITSRSKYWPNNVHILELDVFKENEAVEFIKKSLNIEADVEDNIIEVLAKKLHYSPLALQQTVSYIKTQNEKLKSMGSEFKIYNYLEKYNEKVDCFEGMSAQSMRTDHIETIVTTWNITFDIISQNENGSNALKILGIASYLASENISTNLFVNLINSEDKVNSAIQLLKEYSIINLTETTFSIHKLVQEVIRRKLENENKDKEILIEALKYFLNNGVNTENINHAISIWNYTEKYSELVIKYIYVAHFIINEFIISIRYDEAYLFCQRFLNLLSTLSHNDIILVNILLIKNIIGLIHVYQGKYDIAGEIFLKVFDECIARSYYLELSIVGYNVGFAFFHQGKYNETLKYYQIACSIIESKFKNYDKNIEFLNIQSDIAGVLFQQGKYNKALQMAEKTYKIQKQILGENHHDTLHTQNIITTIFAKQGKYSEALKMCQEAYDITSKTLKQYHPLVLTLKADIAKILFMQGKFINAFNMIQEVLNLQKQVLRSDHPEILETRSFIAEMLREQGKYNEAMVICQDVLNKREQIFGIDHPENLRTLISKANILKCQEKYEIALQIFTELLSKWKHILTEDHPEIIDISNHISEIYEKLNNTAEDNKTLNSLQQKYEKQRKCLGDNHPTTLQTQSDIGWVFYNQKKFDIAWQIFEENYNKFKIVLPNHYYIHKAKIKLAIAATALGKHEEGLRMLQEVYQYYQKNLGENHVETISVKCNMSTIFLNQLKYVEASEILCDVIKREKMLGFEYTDSKVTINNIRYMLMYAMKYNDVKVIKQFFEKCADVTVADLNGTVLLCDSIESGKADIVNIFLKNGADVTSVNSQGKTPLHVATFKGHEQIVKNLLQHVNHEELYNFVNTKTIKTGSTSLHIAAKYNNLKICQILLEHGAKYNVKNNNDKTPFSLSKNPDIISLFKLIKKLFEDAKNGNIRLVNKIKAINSDQFKAVINARNDEGNILFQVLKNNGHRNILKMYLEVLKYKCV